MHSLYKLKRARDPSIEHVYFSGRHPRGLSRLKLKMEVKWKLEFSLLFSLGEWDLLHWDWNHNKNSLIEVKAARLEFNDTFSKKNK